MADPPGEGLNVSMASVKIWSMVSPVRITRAWYWRLLSVLLAGFFAAVSPLAAQTVSSATTNLATGQAYVKAVDLESAATNSRSAPVSLQGVVLMSFAPRCWFALDDTSAFRMHLSRELDLKRGDLIVATGLPTMKEGRPWLEQGEVKVIGRGAIPAPKKIHAQDSVTGGHDSENVSNTRKVEGYGDYFLLGGTNEEILVNSSGIFLKAILPAGAHSKKLFPIGTIAEFTGVCRHGSHLDGASLEARTMHIVLHGPEDIRVLWTNAASWISLALLMALGSGVITFVLLRWRKARQMRASELRFQALVENSFDLTLVLNRDLSIKYVSPSAAALLGIGGKNNSAMESIHPGDRALIARIHAEVLESPGSSRRVPDYRLIAADGAVIRAEAIGTNCLRIPGVEGIVLNVRDVTERRMAEEKLHQLNADLEKRVAARTAELRQANEHLQKEVQIREQAEENLRLSLASEKELNQLKNSFVSMVSHEFRTPLEVILSSSDILDRYLDRLPPESRAAQLRAIRKSVRRMNDLIDDVLLLAKFDAGVLACQPAALDLAACCRRAISEIESASMREGAIRFNATGINGDATADEGLLFHILTNLLGNAVKYSPPGKPLELSVSRQGVEAEFVVRDNGCGIPKSDVPRLFTAFYRGSNVSQTSGSGLGLVITKRCVDLHGGQIRCESTEGVGTTFKVTLPLFDETRHFRRVAKNFSATL